MSGRELRRNLAILPIGTVRELTLLTDRQIRYYEQHGLISPKRGDGGQRRFSLNDVDQLLNIKDHLDAGDSTKDIKEIFEKQARKARQSKNTDQALRRSLQDEFAKIGRFDVR
ncbi:MerR family transcriptional regulator [Convivina intestini]|uniref:MerR family glutamine synthetase transcriptional repressor n=1 Tax=Convivina intestini TaxID=1505726 RepID=A0A2U1DC14_9LACO|nr:MerR family transcriptional regulator [Convivina intestini]PVY85196.1 MerR family glutamine synthetase transcriptional repressor [Convivina intestini]CAH1852373.1 HTH-type transcriptional regulator GlnR [Convivina intestini]CAH1854574.1 HTH-type transcriptional regulator GlnR [Convivina intestini]SDC00343.1 MerR family transcriptional regulator, glutamine synthetase repressor [Leuconostocaceae bacterium R-53105]